MATWQVISINLQGSYGKIFPHCFLHVILDLGRPSEMSGERLYLFRQAVHNMLAVLQIPDVNNTELPRLDPPHR